MVVEQHWNVEHSVGPTKCGSFNAGCDLGLSVDFTRRADTILPRVAAHFAGSPTLAE